MPKPMYQIKYEALWPSLYQSQRYDMASTTTCFLFPLLIPPTLSSSDVMSLCKSPIGQGVGEEREKKKKAENKINRKEYDQVKSTASDHSLQLPSVLKTENHTHSPEAYHVKGWLQIILLKMYLGHLANEGQDSWIIYTARKSDGRKGEMNKRTEKEV